MLNLHEETRCTVVEIITIFIVALGLMVITAAAFDYALEKEEEFTRARLDAQITPEQRADVMGGGK